MKGKTKKKKQVLKPLSGLAGGTRRRDCCEMPKRGKGVTWGKKRINSEKRGGIKKKRREQKLF